MRAVLCRVAVLGLVLVGTGCTGSWDQQTPVSTSASATGQALGSVAAFQDFSGLTVPAGASGVNVPGGHGTGRETCRQGGPRSAE